MDLAKDKEKLKHGWLYEAETEYKQVCKGTVQSSVNGKQIYKMQGLQMC